MLWFSKKTKLSFTYDCHMCHNRMDTVVDSKGAGTIKIEVCPHCNHQLTVSYVYKNRWKVESVMADMKITTNSEHRYIRDCVNWFENEK